MKKARKNIDISQLQLNSGQIPWLPKNPRQWTKTDVENTANSITEDPDFLEDRPLLVVPFNEAETDYLVFGGNLRREGCEMAEENTPPCVVYYPESDEDYETIKRRAMKDNGSFGKWDFDTLANEWDDLPLPDYGVPAWMTPSEGSETGHKSTKEPQANSRAAGANDVQNMVSFFVHVKFENADEQLAFLAEMEERGLVANI